MNSRGCALVTGASRGIGAAIARGLAADGWAVGVNYREQRDAADSVVAEIRDAGGEAIALQADIATSEAAEELCRSLEADLGKPILVLVNNAATGAARLAAQMDEESWQAVIETNLSAANRLIRRALRTMLRERFGRIVNVASAAVWRTTPGQSNYVAAKAGLIGLTKAVAVEVAPRSVTVNAIAPGLIETDSGARFADSMRESIPAKRLGAPEEVAACARFLASEEAAYVTGSVLTVDGGFSFG
jgi:3-oxoacyl-[acyl-carrier protein] reductase